MQRTVRMNNFEKFLAWRGNWVVLLRSCAPPARFVSGRSGGGPPLNLPTVGIAASLASAPEQIGWLRISLAKQPSCLSKPKDSSKVFVGPILR